MTAITKNTPASHPAKSPAKDPAEPKTLVDMSDFDPEAAEEAHRNQIARDHGEDALRHVDDGDGPAE